MQFGIILGTVIVYVLALFLAWRERAPSYVVGLLGAHLAVVLSPIWQVLYGFSYAAQFPLLLRFGGSERFALLDRLQGYGLPWPVFYGAWVMVLPAMAVFFLFRHRWWFPGYLTSLLTFILFVLYHLFVEIMGMRQGWWRYSGQIALPLGVQPALLSALMNGLVTLGVLAALLLTRRYSLTSLLLLVLPIPLLLSLLVHGLLGAPLITTLLLRAQSWAGIIGLIGTLVLLASAVHIVASSLERPREWRETI